MTEPHPTLIMIIDDDGVEEEELIMSWGTAEVTLVIRLS